MNRIAIPLLAIGLLLLPPTIGAQAEEAEGASAYTLIAEFIDGQYVWVLADTEEVNPTLVVPPNTEVTITITQGASSAGVPHNIKVGADEESEFITDEGDTLDYTFTSPPSGEMEYLCTVHPSTMLGTVQVASGAGETPPPGGSESPPVGDQEEEAGGEDTPAPGVALALAALAALALVTRRRA